MKKRRMLAAALLAFAVMICMPGTARAHLTVERVIWAETDEVRSGTYNCNLHYEIGRDEELYSYMRVSGSGEMADYVDPGFFCDPSWHPAYWSLTNKDGYSFSQIAKLYLEPGITRIGNGAFLGHPGGFSGNGATCSTVFLCFPVTIPDTVTWIGDGAFANNNYMGAVTIPDSVTHIGKDAFFYNVIIHCSYGSYAYEYAMANDYRVSLIGPDKLSAPALKAGNEASTGRIRLSWDKQYGADVYEIYRAAKSSGSFELFAKTSATSYIDTSVPVGSKYYYKVKALSKVNPRVNSSDSAVVSRCADLPKVTGLKAKNLTESGKVKLSWDKVTGAAGYRVYRATSSGGSYTLQKTIDSVNTLTYTDSTATLGKTYYYKVCANHTNSSADGAKSASVSAVRKPKQAAAPSLSCTSTGMKVKITSVAGAYGYRIYRKAAGKSSFTRVASTTKLSWIDKNVKSGKSYTYKIAAYVKSPAGTIVAGKSGSSKTKTYRR